MTSAQRVERANQRAESMRRSAESQAEASRALRWNVCPRCGQSVKRNHALTGWVQCVQFGSEQFRRIPFLPACDWQGFTE